MELSLTELLTGPLVIGIRISGLMLFAPFFGNAAIPPRIKAILVILITAVLYPVYSAQVGIVTLAQWPGVVAREFVLGVAIGLATNFVFEAAQMAGAGAGRADGIFAGQHSRSANPGGYDGRRALPSDR